MPDVKDWVSVNGDDTAVPVSRSVRADGETSPQCDIVEGSGQYWSAPQSSWSPSQSLASRFLDLLVDLPIDAVYATMEVDALHILTVIDQPDRSLQRRIYEAEVAFLSVISGLPLSCEFTVLYRLGRPIEQVIPVGARQATKNL